jgi:hypothetical protein
MGVPTYGLILSDNTVGLYSYDSDVILDITIRPDFQGINNLFITKTLTIQLHGRVLKCLLNTISGTTSVTFG